MSLASLREDYSELESLSSGQHLLLDHHLLHISDFYDENVTKRASCILHIWAAYTGVLYHFSTSTRMRGELAYQCFDTQSGAVVVFQHSILDISGVAAKSTF
jgi:hypothetical protein